MRTRWALFALLLGLGIGLAGASRQAASADEESDRIAKLVKQLGSTKFTERHRAKAELEALGARALEALRKAASSSDLETSRRAEEIVKKLENKITTDSLLAPKKVRLKLKDTPVPDAVAELAKQSGYSIQLLGDRAALAGRKVTLDTGATTFWEAYDLLCQKAGLVEMVNGFNPYASPYAPGIDLPVQPLPPIRIQPAPIRIRPAPPVKQLLPALPPAAPQPLQLQGGAVQLQFKVQVQAVQVPAVPAQPVPAPKVAAPAPVQAPPAQAPAIPPQAPPAPALPVQVKPLPVQVQPAPPIQIQPAPPVQIQPVPIQIRPGVIRRPPVQPAPLGQLNLTDGKPQALPTCYAGAIRIRVLPQGQPAQGQPQQLPGRLQPIQPPAPPRRPGEVVLTLEVTPEPRMQQFNVTGSVQLDRAIDEHGQKLTVPMDAPAAPGPVGGVALGGRVYYYNPYMGAARTVSVVLKLGEKPAKTLKEFSGQVPVQMLAPPQALLTVENVLKAAGKTVKGVSGGSIEVIAIEKQADGNWKVQFRMETPPGQILAPFPGAVQIMPAGQVQIQINGRVVSTSTNTHGLPALVDAKGKAFQLVQIPQRAWRGGIGVQGQDLTMVFRAQDGQGEPAQLVLSGQRTVTVPVAFTFRDVRLP